MTEPIKYCKDCRHYSSGGLGLTDLCHAPAICRVDPVLGHLSRVPKQVRADANECGPQARHFEAKLTLWQKLTGKGTIR